MASHQVHKIPAADIVSEEFLWNGCPETDLNHRQADFHGWQDDAVPSVPQSLVDLGDFFLL